VSFKDDALNSGLTCCAAHIAKACGFKPVHGYFTGNFTKQLKLILQVETLGGTHTRDGPGVAALLAVESLVNWRAVGELPTPPVATRTMSYWDWGNSGSPLDVAHMTKVPALAIPNVEYYFPHLKIVSTNADGSKTIDTNVNVSLITWSNMETELINNMEVVLAASKQEATFERCLAKAALRSTTVLLSRHERTDVEDESLKLIHDFKQNHAAYRTVQGGFGSFLHGMDLKVLARGALRLIKGQAKTELKHLVPKLLTGVQHVLGHIDPHNRNKVVSVVKGALKHLAPLVDLVENRDRQLCVIPSKA
jgi:hypothetical protein